MDDKGGGRGTKKKSPADAKALEIEYLEGELEALAEKEREEVRSCSYCWSVATVDLIVTLMGSNTTCNRLTVCCTCCPHACAPVFLCINNFHIPR